MDKVNEGVGRQAVLIVEPYEDGASSLAELCRLWGYEVCVATCAAEALRIDPIPDIVVLELRLPDLDGCELTRQIKGRANGKCPHFITITTCVRDEDRRRAAEAGIEIYLIKPADPLDLLVALRKLAPTINSETTRNCVRCSTG